MPTNDFLPIATSGGAYVETQATFTADASVLANGFPAGILTKEKLNKVLRQSSIMSSVLAQYIADLTGINSVDDGTITALLSGLKSTANAAGHVMFFAASTAPAGYIKANGATISRATYAALFLAIGEVYGAGDGSTTFALPDLRGEFLRGFDDGRGADLGRAIGTKQDSSLITASIGADVIHSLVVEGATINHATPSEFNEAMQTDVVVDSDYSSALKGYTLASGESAYTGNSAGLAVSAFANRPINSNTFFAAGGARPRNIALLACIKF